MEQKDLNVYDIFGEIKNTDETLNNINSNINLNNNINNNINNDINNEVVENNESNTFNYYDDDYIIEQKIQELLGNTYDSSFGNVDNNKVESFDIDEFGKKADEVNAVSNFSFDMETPQNTSDEQVDIIDVQQSSINNSFVNSDGLNEINNAYNNVDTLNEANNNYSNESFVKDESFKFDEYVYPKNEVEVPDYETAKEDIINENVIVPVEPVNEVVNPDYEYIEEAETVQNDDVKSLDNTYLKDDGTVETVETPAQENEVEEVQNEEVKENVVNNKPHDIEKKSGNGFIIFVFILMALTIIFLPYIYELLK